MKRMLIGLVIGLVALWLAFRKMEWQAFWDALTAGNLGWILMGSIALLLAIPIRGLRWCIFMQPVKPVSPWYTSEATLVGYFGNNALPLRLGELLKAYFLARMANAPLVQVIGTIIVERLIDILSVLLILAFMPLLGAIPESLRRPVIWAVVIGAVVAVITVWLAYQREGMPFVKGRLKHLLDQLRLAFDSLSQTHHYLRLLATSVGIWVFYLLSIVFVQHAMGLDLSLAECYLILVATTLILLIPAAPGFVGTFHAAVVLVLMNILSVEQSQAQATAVVLHAIGYIPYTVFGAISFLRSHVRIREIKGLSVKSAEETEA
jgi:uncharacterized protein (TIRG00374 family)